MKNKIKNSPKCFWCKKNVCSDGDLCDSCFKKKNESDAELSEIEKEFDNLFNGMDCKEMILLFKSKNERIKDLEEHVEQIGRVHIHNKNATEDLKKENERLAELCDKLNKDYFEQKNIAAEALKELSIQIRDQKLYENRTCILDETFLCSLCGASQADIRKKYSNFCSNCGAKIIAGLQ